VDETRLRQILLNLISNAIKFTDVGGAIVLAAKRRADGAVCFEIRDTGVGMSAEEIDVAFQPFGQVESDHNRSHQGTGLGLPLARRLVELHGGSLRLTSKKGCGTTVRVTLPAWRTMSASAQVSSSDAAA
jgi:two-component system, cell cycle sensor histidine kinase PleC